MKALLIVVTALAIGALGYFFLAPPPQVASERLAGTDAAPGKPAPLEEKLTLQTNEDAAEVFRRAFWREPAAEDRILHAQRREWVSEEDGVRRWQWFLAVEPGAELSRWLREENPFRLMAISTSGAPARIPAAPAWFPADGPAGAVVQRSPDGAMQLIFDPAANVFYVTDAGHGFAVAAKTPAAPTVAAHGPGLLPDGESPRRGSSNQPPPR